ncbi:hypothetical protein EUGRSUZ_H00747 [Eucalyptus grandis]|uniref:Uncharacterized protein n=2 Tax=Eucalyptus grandis TaxID=71139 RepID=A0ACC3JM83_EUCGR|nr:hypothetical protein EUGRSUZ_H00747 [Eucalyptus grandis]
MKGFSRAKRITGPLDEWARARLLAGRRQLSYVSSGSEHDGEDCTPRLSELVQCFLEEGDGGSEVHSPGRDPDSDPADSDSDSLEDALAPVSAGAKDPYRDLLLDHVLRAVEAFSGLRASQSLLRRRVMSSLREIGHNAAVCKSRWESSGGLTAGNYEFIDVLGPAPASAPASATATATAPAAWQQQQQQQQTRYFVDLDFAGGFEIARPTSRYARLLRSLPERRVHDTFCGHESSATSLGRRIKPGLVFGTTCDGCDRVWEENEDGINVVRRFALRFVWEVGPRGEWIRLSTLIDLTRDLRWLYVSDRLLPAVIG